MEHLEKCQTHDTNKCEWKCGTEKHMNANVCVRVTFSLLHSIVVVLEVEKHITSSHPVWKTENYICSTGHIEAQMHL